MGVDGAVAGAANCGEFGGEFGEGGCHLHELGGNSEDVAFCVLAEPGGCEVADLGPDLVVDDVEFGKFNLVAGQDTFAAKGFDEQGPLGSEPQVCGGGGVQNVNARGLEDALEDCVAPVENFKGRNILIKECFGAGGGGREFEIDVGDAGKSAEGAGEEFGEVEAGDVLDDHAAGLDGAALECDEVHADDEVADGAEEAAAIAGGMGGEDAADG